MRIQSDTIISFSDADFLLLIADALDRNVLLCPSGAVRVDEVEEEWVGVENRRRWKVTFGLEVKK